VKFVGFSDFTSLLLSIYYKTGIVTFHGPSVKKFGSINNKSIKFFKRIISTTGEISLDLKKRKSSINSTSEEMSGTLVGGNLSLFAALLGTPYFKFLKNKDYILFFEDTNISAAQLDFLLRQINFRMGQSVVKNIKAIILGSFKDYYKESIKFGYESELSVFAQNFKSVPIIKTGLFGHGQKDFATFPIGAKARLSKKLDTINFILK
ncbi:MAG: hypothetical protein V1656_03440, partial [Candidatus Jorgensenbacteria bacterium]